MIGKITRRVRNKVRNIVLAIQASVLIPVFVRRWLLNRMGAQIHRTAIISYGVFIGDPSKLVMGPRSAVNVGCLLDGCDYIFLGHSVRLAMGCTIITGTHTIQDDVMRRDLGEPIVRRAVVIERGCWLGADVTVLPGVTINEGVVVGAKSLVARDVPPNVLIGTEPARIIRELPVQSTPKSFLPQAAE